ncbi:Rnp domain protein [Neofusicoccum parvum]|uniref:Rnp domain protein n=2 Tax=Neofusicoccum parvum TaxID=310453 RepID=A0ACB5SHA7_9PEZI|nr:putative rnp domain protein [Neofusicoccum parvum UCRNP2]GME40896.1 Rnp domain protein [Neofusicoccum parvum]GME64242.1 Rnp domain protein [Neofusicoccum parvum]
MSAPEVDSATAQMANTTLTEPTGTAEGASVGAGGDKPINASENEAVIASAAEGRRLYIGNLAYATTEGELKEFFKDYLVESTSIPTNPRTTRPVGYAFVDLSTPTEAERAITELNGKAILDRKVSIQLARKPEAHGEGAGSGGEGANGSNSTRRRTSTRGRGRGRGRGGRAARGGRSEEGQEKDGEAPAAADPAATAPTNVPGQVIPLTETTNEALTAEKGAEGTTTVNPKTAKTHVQRERKQRGPPEDGVPSKTKVMVANLPYDLREEKLLEIFKDYQPQSAKIALRPIPRFMVKKLQARNEPRKGRGFGFVTLASEELQQKACTEMNGKEIEGREIAVKVAIDSPGKEDEDPAATIEGAPATETEEAAPSTAEAPASVEPATAST